MGDGTWHSRIDPAGLGETHLITRLRLLDVVRARFDVRLTVIHGGPGYGKSTLLAQATTENALDPLGIDVTVPLRTRDRSPTQFIATVSAALTGDPDAVETVDGLCQWLLLKAPEEVVIVLDDVHLLDGSETWPFLVDLLDGLPTNGHLVIASRTMPDLGVRRRQATGAATIIGPHDLEFTADELDSVAPLLAATTPGDAAQVPRWPALAVLSQRVGRHASIEYLWAEILVQLDPDRRAALASVVRLDFIDDELVRAVLGSDWTTASLTAGLPLVALEDGRARFHDLWRHALYDEVPPSRWRPALAAGAEVLLDRGEFVTAVDALHNAGSTDRLVEVVRRFVSQAVSVGLYTRVAESCLTLIPKSERRGALGAHLTAIVRWSTDQREALLEAAGERAAKAGDGELGALAVWRLTQILGDTDPWNHVVTDEMRRLADEGWPLARSAVILARSFQAQGERDIERALAEIEHIDGPDPATRRSSMASRFVSLGHPEQVEETLFEVLESGISEPATAHACWLRGDIGPDEAWSVARHLPERYGDRLPDIVAALASIVSTVAIAAGHFDDARRVADHAQQISRSSAMRVRHYADVADALVVLAVDGEDTAQQRFDAILAEMPVEPFPSWPHLGALTPLRAMRADLEWLDELDFGPSLTVAVRAGRIIAEMREGAPPERATDLPWGQGDLLRVHVPPPMLIELAVAAAPTSPEADALLTKIPSADRFIRRITAHPNAAVAALVAHRVGGTPEPPGYELTISCLGDFRVSRSDGVELSTLDRKDRIRQLLAELVVEGSVTRDDVSAKMWPDLQPDAAANNLRVTLNKLIELVDPHCGPAGSWWIRADRERIELHDDGLVVDVREFDLHLASAREAEAHGAPSVADEHYRKMGELYRGAFLPAIEDVWVLPERLRLQSLAYAAACRRAELQLARGEPELAMQHASRAVRLDLIGERAQRLLVKAHLALGSTSAAMESAAQLRRMLSDAGLRPDRQTEAVLAHLE